MTQNELNQFRELCFSQTEKLVSTMENAVDVALKELTPPQEACFDGAQATNSVDEAFVKRLANLEHLASS